MHDELLKLRDYKKTIKKRLFKNEDIGKEMKENDNNKYLKFLNISKDYISFSLNKKMKDMLDEDDGEDRIINIVFNIVSDTIVDDDLPEEALEELIRINIDHKSNKIYITVR